MHQHLPQKGFVARTVALTGRRAMKEASAEIINQAKDFVAFALARSLHQRRRAFARPGISQCPPLRKTGFVAKQSQRVSGARLS